MKLTKLRLDWIVGSNIIFIFSVLQSFGHFFGHLVFYLFGPLDSVYLTSSTIIVPKITEQNHSSHSWKFAKYWAIENQYLKKLTLLGQNRSSYKSIFFSGKDPKKLLGFFGIHQRLVDFSWQSFDSDREKCTYRPDMIWLVH